MSTAADTPAPRRRRRWPIVLLVVLLVFAALLAGAAVLAEHVARGYATDLARTKLASKLGVPPSEMTVKLGGGSILIQALGGRIDEVTATTDDLEISGITARLRLTAHGVPTSADETVDAIDARVEIPAAQASKLGALVPSLPIVKVAYRGSAIAVSSSATVLGLSVPLELTLKPSASGGRLVLTPTTVTAAGQTLAVADLRSGPLGGIVRQLPENVSVCVNERLPGGLDLGSASVAKKTLVLTATGAHVPLSGGGRGSCS